MNKKLRYVSDIMFAYFQQRKCGDAGNGDYLGGLLPISILGYLAGTISTKSISFSRYKNSLRSQGTS